MAKKKRRGDIKKEFAEAAKDRKWPIVHTNTTFTIDPASADPDNLTSEDVSAIINAALRSGMLRIHIEDFDTLVSLVVNDDKHYATEVELDGSGACAMSSDGDDTDSEVQLVLSGDRGFCAATLREKPSTKKKAAKKKK